MPLVPDKKAGNMPNTDVTEVLRIPIPVEALEQTLGEDLVNEALEHGRRTADAAALSPRTGITAAEATAGGYLAVDVIRKMNVGNIYAQRLELALAFLDRDQRNAYEAALAAQARGDLTVVDMVKPRDEWTPGAMQDAHDAMVSEVRGGVPLSAGNLYRIDEARHGR